MKEKIHLLGASALTAIAISAVATDKIALVPEAEARKCQHNNCGTTAIGYPRFKVWACGHKPGSHPPASVVIEAPLCLDHMGIIRDHPKALMTTRTRRLLDRELRLARKQRADWDTLETDVISFADHEANKTKAPNG